MLTACPAEAWYPGTLALAPGGSAWWQGVGVLVMNPMTVRLTLKCSMFLNIRTLKRLYDILIKTSFFCILLL